ncbi:MAG: rod-binding protein [Roseovarius sp.]|uniref:rod-binding protein n=1 Tax=Roseovarius sp. TaxID=1486281 RepID=UPI0032EC6832
MTDSLPVSTHLTGLRPTTPKPDIRVAAERLEASFLAEMLKSAGVGEQENSMSGSIGESQFASFHREALAREMVARGGIGLADRFEASLRGITNE